MLKSVLFIPYIKNNNKIKIFLQKRTKDAKNMPGFYGFWGGLVENGENIEEALIREIKEELDIKISNYNKLGIFNFGKSEKHIFVKEVLEDFENSIDIKEGDEGRWFNLEEVKKEEKIREDYKEVISRIINKLN